MRRTAAVVRLDLSHPLEPIHVDPRYDDVLLVVAVARRIVGQVFVEARPILSPEEQWQAIATALGEPVMRALIGNCLARAATPPGGEASGSPSTAVIVCTRHRPDDLDRCLASIASLRTPPVETLVVDNSEGDDPTAEVCRRHGVRRVVEPIPGQTRARNRALLETQADVVAFTDDDCVVDELWLDGLGRAFRDPLVMCVTGYIGPLELETPAQYLFERHGGFERRPRRTVYDLERLPPLLAAAVAGAGANMFFRREVFARTGNFAEELGPGTPARSSDDKYQFYRLIAAGYRIVYEPQRIVWHRHRRDTAGLRRIFNDYGVAEFAYITRCLVTHREPSALHLYRWWLGHIAREIAQAVAPGPRDIPLTLALEELRGALRGPRALQQSIASRRNIAPIPPPAAPAAREAPAGAPTRVAAELPSLSVAVATHNRRERLARVLGALSAQEFSRGHFEVVVIVDGSTDRSAEMARALEIPYDLRVIEQDNRGLAATRNRGAEEARHPIVVFLDDDIELTPGALIAHARAHVESPQRWALGYYPPAVTADSLWGASLRFWWEDHFGRKAATGHQWSFLDVVDGNSSIPVELLKDAGGFDERFRGGRRQDCELGVRLLKRGVPISFHADAMGWHHFDARLDKAFRSAAEEGRYDVLLAEMHPEVKGRLPLATIAWRLRRPRRAALIEHRLLRRVPSESMLPALDVLERVHMRGRWRWLLNHGLMRSYWLGAMEACGGREQLHAFLTDILDSGHGAAQEVRLDAPGRLTLPATHPAPIDLRLRYGERPVASIAAMRPNEQWDIEQLLERGEDELTWPIATRLGVDALLRPSPAADPSEEDQS